MKRYQFLILGLSILLLGLLLSACNISLASDIIPPTGAVSQVNTINQNSPVAESQPAPELTGPLYPLVPPNPAAGESIFAEKCAPCHGETGMGDGSLADQLPNPAPAIGTEEVARKSTPAEWYRIVTEGNLERRMPPFTSLSDRQRWDVLAYVYSLSNTPERFTQGQALYDDNCASCHGASYLGDSTSAQPVNLADLKWMTSQTGDGLFQMISNGISPDMPAFMDKLSTEEIWVLADYLRLLPFNNPGEMAAEQQSGSGNVEANPVSTPDASNPEASLTVQDSTTEVPDTSVGADAATDTAAAIIVKGTITNTALDSVAAGSEVLLRGFDDMQMVISQTTQVKEDGTFEFADVPTVPGRSFLATLDYEGVTYGSDVVLVEDGKNEIDLPITVYGSTTESSNLVIDRLHIFLEPVDAETVRIIELLIFSNLGDKTIIPVSESEPALKFILPEGSTNLAFQDGQIGDRYVQTEDGFGDMAAIRPGMGTHQILLAFEMPYKRKLEFSQPMSMSTNAIVVLVPEESYQVKGDNLQDTGTRTVDGFNYRTFNQSGLEKGENLQLTINQSSKLMSPISSSNNSSNLLIGLAFLGGALIIAGLFIYLRSRKDDKQEAEEEADLTPTVEDTPDAVMDAMLALDDLYKAGELPEEAYRARRDDLKERLRILME
jgi:mono/diheme cytochrome c family protein